MSFSQLLKENSKEVWEACYQHPFVQELGQGSLDKESFMFYLKQDYVYLIEYAKMFALMTVKANDEATMQMCTRSSNAVLNEMDNHRAYMQRYGIGAADAEKTKPSLFNKAYTANMMAVGYNEGLLELLATVLPCAWTYGDFGQRLKKDFGGNLKDNYYKSWIEAYASEEFNSSFQWFFPLIDKLAQNKAQAQLDHVMDVFKTSVEFEYLFWDMAYKKQMSF